MIWVFSGVMILVIVVGYFYHHNYYKKLNQLKKEKAAGKWDFIHEEYLPYLNSYKSAPIHLRKTSVIYKNLSDTWKLSADIYFNKAGMFVDFENTNLSGSPDYLFIRGKEKPSRFAPRLELFCHDVIRDKNEFIQIQIKTNEKAENYYAKITLKIIDEDLYMILKSVFLST